MRVTGSRVYTRPTPTPKMPPGLVELMEGLAKDVLRNNPEDVYEFCAEHMQKLLIIRDGTPPKKPVSLEQKIKKAQEKIRQKIKNRRLEEEITTRANEPQEERKNSTKNEPIMESPPRSMKSSRTPVYHAEDGVMAHNEEEISHEPEMIKATTDNHTQEEVFEENDTISKTTLESEDSKNVKENVKEISVDMKEGLVILSDTLENETLRNKLEAELKRPSVDIEESVPVTSIALQSNESAHEVKEELIVLMVNTTPQTSETSQSDEERNIKIDVEFEENITGHTKPHSDTEKVIYAPENPANSNDNEDTVNDLEDTLRHEMSLDSEETLKPNKSIVIDIAMIDIKGEVEGVPIISKLTDDKVIKVNSNGNGVMSFQQQNETFDCGNLPSVERTPIQTPEIDKNQVNIINNEHEVKAINNNTNIINSVNSKNENHDDQIESKESNIEINNDASLLESQLVKAIIEEHLSVNELKPEAETEELVKFVEGNQLPLTQESNMDNDKKAITGGNKNLEHSNGQMSFNQNDVGIPNTEENITDTVAKLLEQERHISSELIDKDNVIVDNSSIINTKDETKSQHDDSTKNQTVSGMDLETAAITIQKVFRTFMFSKSRASTLEETANEVYLSLSNEDEHIEKKDEPEYVIPSAISNKERRALGLSRMDTVLQTVNEEKSLSLSTDDSSTLSSAATTIQAHVRGFLVRNKLSNYKTGSGSSLVNSEGPSTVSLDGDTIEPKKTILNIHIIPERGQFMSRDESMLTSIDLPLDNSPPSSVNLHPLGYDKSEPRKQLKREDAIQSVSPPSNNSGKLSEEVDSVKDVLVENSADLKAESENANTALVRYDKHQDADAESCDTTLTISSTADTVIDAEAYNTREVLSSPEHHSDAGIKDTVTNLSSDEMDVVTPFPNVADKTILSQETVVDEKPKLVHTGEFHDTVLQTQVKRSESSVVRGE